MRWYELAVSWCCEISWWNFRSLVMYLRKNATWWTVPSRIHTVHAFIIGPLFHSRWRFILLFPVDEWPNRQPLAFSSSELIIGPNSDGVTCRTRCLPWLEGFLSENIPSYSTVFDGNAVINIGISQCDHCGMGLSVIFLWSREPYYLGNSLPSLLKQKPSSLFTGVALLSMYSYFILLRKTSIKSVISVSKPHIVLTGQDWRCL